MPYSFLLFSFWFLGSFLFVPDVALRMRKYVRFGTGELIRFILMTMIVFVLFYQGIISATLLIFFECLFVLRFIHIKKFLEEKLFNHYSWYARSPKWGKWIILLICYLLIFFFVKWFIINVIAEGIFHIPLDDELQQMVDNLQETP